MASNPTRFDPPRSRGGPLHGMRADVRQDALACHPGTRFRTASLPWKAGDATIEARGPGWRGDAAGTHVAGTARGQMTLR